MKRAQDKVVIITGGASGIGRVSALRFAAEGAIVVIWDIDMTKAEATRTEVEAQGGQAVVAQVNTTQPEQVAAAAQAVQDKFGRIDVLINNAGITRDASLRKMTFAQWQQVIDVNLTGVFVCAQAVAPYMEAQRSGRIINTSSVVGLYGNFGQSNYAATKAGLIGLTKTLARELGKYNITVNAVAPGFMATDMLATIPEKVLDALKSRTPLGRLGKPEDIAAAYLFLASDEAGYVSGTVLSVDGAITI
ncbi:3-oxoacyl-ACP reductase FabG [Hymenobacter sp. BT770]|uniref:3-oxoacyl-ACP reductase FabG n=1 Tax=Hymenobacter sp. BT770 TaxID=2886942 RepID=UPI001D1145F5|nr:3-oxoacyl-ACP reductase FabG [Hymenobacter sp. BT770]MCC3155409.1 3-oxoacyl-ACP reductase FabG [Hymenobacter sp. BT770]MDO3417460.1 3-oxoacyl-ACP reductase FabG [Hymenobacter sp. BT770]